MRRVMGFLAVLIALALSGVAFADDKRAPESLAELKLSYAPLVKQTAPAVVNVYVTRRVKRFVSPFQDPFFRQFFGDDLGVPRERLENSLGSGVIVSADGLVVTNAHVIKGSGEAEIRIALADKREIDAKVILMDERADLAVLKIDARETFPYLEMVDSDKIEVGDIVLAIGNPFGVGQTVTTGIVSALARTAVGNSDTQYFIQTDAAINPGNSGGALVDMSGKLVGINTAIFSRSGGSQGVGFAIPANMVKPFVESAVTGRALKRPWLGAKLEPVTREIADALGLPRVTGAFVAKVYDEGPAKDAGLQEKDVIVGIDAHEVEDPRALTYRMGTLGVGASAKLRVLRGGAEQTVDIALAEAPSFDQTAQRELSGAHPFDGTRVALLSPALAEEIGLDDLAGVVITAIRSGSIAQGLGLRPGDVIVRVGGSRIDSLDELSGAIDQPRSLWRVEIRRGNRILKLVVPG
ncbi:MAG: Do family serine endopeptidase [Hyphomicrobiaceae bacterium]